MGESESEKSRKKREKREKREDERHTYKGEAKRDN